MSSMKVLVIIGSDLRINSSANLCHSAYIQGLLDNGCEVDLLTVGDKKEIVHNGQITEYRYPMKNLYEYLGSLKNNKKATDHITTVNRTDSAETGKSVVSDLKRKLKKWVRSFYGPYEVYISWNNKAIRFKSETVYDAAISLSFPPVSHYLAWQLKKKNQVHAKRWIQIWEDPWCTDLIFLSLNDEKVRQRVEKEERRLLRVADEIIYVSPITLDNQRKLFPESGNKMSWYPVPSYYANTDPTIKKAFNQYGYYGNYNKEIRNLEPFYTAARQKNIHVNICGQTDKMFESTDLIDVRSRISLKELKPLEDETNILVFLCNLRGGQIPGKIYQYSSTDKLILFILDGTEEEKKILKEYFGQFNRYIFCDNTLNSISQAIDRIESGDIGDTTNRVLDDFAPQTIISNILGGKEVA